MSALQSVVCADDGGVRVRIARDYPAQTEMSEVRKSFKLQKKIDEKGRRGDKIKSVFPNPDNFVCLFRRAVIE